MQTQNQIDDLATALRKSQNQVWVAQKEVTRLKRALASSYATVDALQKTIEEMETTKIIVKLPKVD